MHLENSHSHPITILMVQSLTILRFPLVSHGQNDLDEWTSLYKDRQYKYLLFVISWENFN